MTNASRPATPPSTPVILRLAVPSPLRRLFDYLAPAGMNAADAAALTPGIRIAVPFGPRTLVGVLVSVHAQSSVPSAKLKQALHCIDDTPLVPPAPLELFLWAA